jgi:hypothetical protein
VYASQPASLLDHATLGTGLVASLWPGRFDPAEARIEVSVQLMFILLDQAFPGARKTPTTQIGFEPVIACTKTCQTCVI